MENAKALGLAMASKLKAKKINGLSRSNLHLYAQFYKGYPQIVQTLSGQLRLPLSIEQKMQSMPTPTGVSNLSPDIQLLINQLSFSHLLNF